MKISKILAVLTFVFLISCSGTSGETRKLDTENIDEVQIQEGDSIQHFYNGTHRIKRRRHSDKRQ
ncbi:hypothetical protein [Zunongwangia endophytica]|uniref:Uncharacterized protein n=1 Tax=Zunongwangia endophytica TaxID=1808945 RepID=A0ABV8H6S2_9FLAO|nr:hypothetical protein [Zunongwangia endophytica]MDN3594751.1 hypothetical protein [Zunongwangia endophytica]